MTPQDIRTKMNEIKAKSPKIRARNMAEQIGVSEGALIAAQVGGNVIRLKDEMQDILTNLESLGEVMALTRNEACVHERHGVYAGGEFSKHGPMTIGLFNTPDIDLRLFMMHWKFAFAVNEGGRDSLQFFDKAGHAIHKIYVTDASNKVEFDKLVQCFQNEEQSDEIQVQPYDGKSADLPDSEIDWEGLRLAWENLGDVHNFFGMLRKFKVGREQAFRKIGADFAYEVKLNSARHILELARDSACEIMVFVGNKGCIQIHTGKVEKLVEHGPWFNVLDPNFNLHLNEEQIAHIWVTKKPTEDGIITAVEVFDHDSEIIATFFGKRKPGQPELTLWREIVHELNAKEVANAAE